MKKVESAVLTRAMKLVSDLTIALTNEISSRGALVDGNSINPLTYVTVTTVLGTTMNLVYRLATELDYIWRKKNHENIEKDVIALMLFFLHPSEWRVPLPFDLAKALRVCLDGHYNESSNLITAEMHEKDYIMLSSLKLRPSAVKSLALSGIVTIGHFRQKTKREISRCKYWGKDTLQSAKAQLEILGVRLDHWVE